jgi:hypothetical protein
MNLKLLAFVLATALALSAALYGCNAQLSAGRSTSPQATSGGAPAISITPAVADLGDVSMSKGTVNTLFTIKNTGTGDLVIRNMETSCMCTQAAVVMGGQEGPRFGMPGMSSPPPADWSATIKAGQEVPLKVYYDPTVHGDLHGPVTRVVRVYSNDPKQPHVDVTIELNQVH